MGLTLIAILSAALLLPGIVATIAFYSAGETPEVGIQVPSLSTATGVAVAAVFSLVVHVVYIGILAAVSGLPPLLSLPLANPYSFLSGASDLGAVDQAFALFAGLLALTGLAFVIGRLAGAIYRASGDGSFFYGPLAELFTQGRGDDRFIIAYVLSKVSDGEDPIGYRGTVASLLTDGDRYPTRLILKDVVPFVLKRDEGRVDREEVDQLIDWLSLTEAEWHNVAFRVYRVADDDGTDADLR